MRIVTAALHHPARGGANLIDDRTSLRWSGLRGTMLTRPRDEVDARSFACISAYSMASMERHDTA